MRTRDLFAIASVLVSLIMKIILYLLVYQTLANLYGPDLWAQAFVCFSSLFSRPYYGRAIGTVLRLSVCRLSSVCDVMYCG